MPLTAPDKTKGAVIPVQPITAQVSPEGALRFVESETGRELLAEKPIHGLSVPARHYLPVRGDLYHIEANFAAYEDEHIYGLGQHQHGRLDQKGCVIDLVQRNTEVSIPFMLSSRGYGFLWNNPAIGRVELGYNATRWVAQAATQIDYWITAGRTPAEVLCHYASATGHVPLLPDWASGFWQSKLRYSTQAELLSIAHQHLERGLPLAVIVIDFFHWTKQGDWQFDPACWPDPAAMVKDLAESGVQVMVSIWPTVNRLSQNFEPMWQHGHLVRTARGTPAQMYFVDNEARDGIYLHYYDPTNPEARQFIWERVREGYYRHGIKVYWLDVCEPEMLPLHPDNLRYHIGDGEAVANAYPFFSRAGLLRGSEIGRGTRDLAVLPIRLGGQPALWGSGVVGRYTIHVRSITSASARWIEYGSERHSVVDNRYRRLSRRRSIHTIFSRTDRSLVPIRHILPPLPVARTSEAKYKRF